MNINIYGKSDKVTESLREAIYSRFDKLSKYETGTYSVTLDVRHGDHVAEAIVHVPNSKDVHASAKTSDMYQSIDELADKLERQLEKIKGKNLEIDRSSITDELLDEE